MRIPILLVLSLPSPAFAHDLWLLPGSTPGSIELAQGMDFPESESPPQRKSFDKIEVIAPDGTRLPVEWIGDVGERARVRFTPMVGTHIAAAVTTPKMIELAADEFNEYLVSDGLAHIWLERAQEKTLDRPGKERYQKWVKSLIKIGDGASNVSRPIGHQLEIVPKRDPTSLAIGETLEVTVLFGGQPLANARVGWDHEGDGPEASGMVRTGADGRALIPIARAGRMALRLTHMTRPKAKDHEWASFWTTLTFAIAK